MQQEEEGCLQLQACLCMSTPPAPAAPPRFGDPVGVPATSPPTLELVDMVAARVEPRRGGQLIKALGQRAPLEGLPHLKRVRKCPDDPAQLEVLICRAVTPLQLSGGGGGSGSGAGGGERAAARLPPGAAELVQEQALEPHLCLIKVWRGRGGRVGGGSRGA